MVDAVATGSCKNLEKRCTAKTVSGNGLGTRVLSWLSYSEYQRSDKCSWPLLSAPGGKHLFKVTCTDPQGGRYSHTLQANGDFDKKAWMDAFKPVVPTILSSSPVTTV